MHIVPLKKFRKKNIIVASDKSITHRAIMFNSFADGTAKIFNPLLGDDCRHTIQCMTALGAKISSHNNIITVDAISKRVATANLNVGNSGTTIRLLTGYLASQHGLNAIIDGDSSIRRRPMNRILMPLKEMGAHIDSIGGFSPLTIDGTYLAGITYNMPVPSAQVKSCILIAGLNAISPTTVIEAEVSRNHTELMLAAMGAKISTKGNSISLFPSRLTSINVEVSGDISSAAFALTLAAIIPKSSVKILNVNVNPTRTGILDVFSQCGVDFKLVNQRQEIESVADIQLEHTEKLKPFKIEGALVPRLIDEIPILAVLACFIKGTSVITGAEELKVKESNRIDAIVTSLKAMGANIVATNDGIIINGTGTLEGGAHINPMGDHRIAMALAVAGAASKNGCEIYNPACVEVSYPTFFELFE